ncbi:MAG: glycosyl hydrolase family 28-related protein, partial [Armatimonadota bacterium]
SLAVRLPDEVSEGRYRVFVHNGFGGASGWSEGPEITVAKPAPWPRESFDVKDFGASGEGMAHDGAAIRAALKQAERNGGGIVYLPRGRYRITGTLEIPRYTVLRGEGTQLVCLFWPDADEPYTLIRGTDHFGIQDLTVYCSNYRHCVEAAVGRPDSGNTFLRRVRVRADIYRGHQKPEQIHERFTASLRLSTGGGDVVRFGGENVEITDCDLYGSGRSLYLLRVRGARISGNTFYNGRWGWYCFDGSDGLIFENNRIIGADLMSTGGSLNCYTSAYSQNVYYAHNRLSLAHGWDREAMTTDAGGGAYYGTAAEIGPDKLVLAGEPDWKGKQDWTGAGVFVLGGRGMGQYRRIAKYDGRVVTLDRPWDVPPDEESLISITMLQRNYLFIGNEFHDVGIALQYYGTSVDHVAFGNKCTRGGGFYNSGRWYHHFQPSWYCQFIENEILEGNCYRFGPNNATDAGPSFLGTFGMQSHDGTAPLALCSLHRRNRLRNNAEIRLIGVDRDNPGLRDVVVEHNVIENAARGIYVDSGCLGVLVRENRFENVERERVSQRQLREEMNKKRAALIGQQDPVAYFSFDNPSDSMVRDVSGHGFWAMGTTRIEFGRGI